MKTDLKRALSLFLVYTLFVILLGALVRATGSGAGCGSHWPLCNGEFVPKQAGDKTWVEYMHRVTSGLCWVFAALMVWFSRRASPPKSHVRGWCVAVLFFMTTEALIGAGVVVFEKVADDASLGRGAWMGAHLVNTFLLLLSLMLAWCYAARPTAPPLRATMRAAPKQFGWWLAILGWVLLVGFSGAIAALGDTLFPAESLAAGIQADLSPTAHVFVRLRIFHPLLALAGVALSMAYAGPALSVVSPAGSGLLTLRRYAFAVMVVGVLQVGLGFLNVLLLAPVWLQLVHLALADALWLALVGLGFERFAALSSQPDKDLFRPPVGVTLTS